MDIISVCLVIFLAVFVQTSIGFGTASISMPLLTVAIGFEIAAPLVALVAVTCRLIILFRYRVHFSFQDIWQLLLATTICIPIGFLLSKQLDVYIVETILGLAIIGYVFFSLMKPNLPSFEKHIWAYGLGGVSGLLAGAYNISGPPVVIYASGKRWPPAKFKGNLQAFALLSSFIVLITRSLNGEFTSTVMSYYWITLPVIALGLFSGFMLDNRISSAMFHKGVLAMLMVIGLRLATKTLM